MVVGSGFVGAEVATTAARLGVDVTVVEAGSSPLGGLLGDEVGSVLEAAYRRCGIELRLGASVERIEPRSVVLEDGTRLAHDVVLVAIGVEPSCELQADGALVAGDATGSGHWTAAAEQGVAAARRLLGLPLGAPQPPFVWSDQLGLRLQVSAGRGRPQWSSSTATRDPSWPVTSIPTGPCSERLPRIVPPLRPSFGSSLQR